MARPAVRCWKSELLIASMNLVLVFIVPHTSSLCLENRSESIKKRTPVIPVGTRESSELTLAKKEVKRETEKTSEDSIPDNALGLCA